MKKYFRKFLYVLVLLVVFILHLSYINNGFVWLDHGDIESGRVVMPFDQLSGALFTRFGDTGFYRPLVAITESIDHSLYGDWTPGYHFTNLIFHLIVVALVPLFLSVFFRFTLVETFLAMLVVGIHPLGWLPVGAIAYRSELLLTLFLFLTLFFHSKARVKGSSSAEFLAVISLFLALLSKETALVLVPATILLWEISRGKHTLKRSIVSLLIPEGIVLGFYLFLRVQAVPELWRFSGQQLSWSDLIGTHLFAVSKLLFDFFNPLQPNLSDAVPVTHLLSIAPLGLVICFILSILVIKKEGMRSQWSRALCLFFIFLSPALGIIPVPRLGSPHYGYVVLIAFAVLIILMLRLFKKLSPILYWGTSASALVWIVIMGYVTFMSGFQFTNDVTLFTPEVQKDQHFLEGYFYLGNYYLLHNEPKLAEDAYDNALKTSPEIIAYNERESTLYNSALTATKIQNYRKVIALLGNKDELHNNPEELLLLANALHHLHKDKEAVVLLQKSKPLWNDEQRKKAEILIDLIKK